MTYKPHALANLFPAQTEKEFDELKKSIKANGLINPIWLISVGDDLMVLDGIHRLKACEELGITPRTELFRGDNPMGFVLAQNMDRRHLSEGQRAAIAADIANMQKHKNKNDTSIDVSQPEAAKVMKVSIPSVQRAKAIKKESPETFEKVKSGELTIGKAQKQLHPEKYAKKPAPKEQPKVEYEASEDEVREALRVSFDENNKLRALNDSLTTNDDKKEIAKISSICEQYKITANTAMIKQNEAIKKVQYYKRIADELSKLLGCDHRNIVSSVKALIAEKRAE